MDTDELNTIWQNILDELRKNISEVACQRWLVPLTPIDLTDRELTLGVPNNFSKTYIENRYIPFIQDAVKESTGRQVYVVLSVTEAEKPEQGSLDLAAESPAPAPQQVIVTDPALPSPISPGDNSSLNPRYTFDAFVTGNSNRLAHAAALAVVESPGTVYNPLFIYGGVGLGKTHLMHAIGNQILQNFPQMRVLYISSERFTNELINSIMVGNSEAFRQKYRSIDALLVDDIQFLYKKEHTQEEFFHTFNTLYDAKKQIILSSDRHPRAIQTLEDRLRSRFEWGLITDISAPDLETRIAILKKKAMSEKVDVPNDVMYFIASRIDNNIRELEGALTRAIAFASLNSKKVTLELVAESMKSIYPTQRTRAVTMELIQEIVAQHFKIETEALLSKKRTRELAFPRQVAMYLCRELTDISLPQIGTWFGRDHTTVIHACEKIAAERRQNSQLDTAISDLIQRIDRV